MPIVDDLLSQGIVTEDLVETDKVIFFVDFHIKKTAINAGAFELFASAYKYKPTITDPQSGLEIQNPESVYDFSKKVLWKFVTETFVAQIDKQADIEKQAKVEAMKQALL